MQPNTLIEWLALWGILILIIFLCSKISNNMDDFFDGGMS